MECTRECNNALGIVSEEANLKPAAPGRVFGNFGKSSLARAPKAGYTSGSSTLVMFLAVTPVHTMP